MTHAPFVLLDNARPGQETLRLFAEPHAVVMARTAAEVPQALARINQAVAAGRYAAGYASYELGYALEPRLLPLLPAPRTVPLLWFGIFDAPQVLDAGWFETQITGRAYAGPLRFAETRESHAGLFDRAQSYIAAGDVYQVNLTFPARFAFLGDALALYAQLRRHAAAPHGGYIDDGERQLLSLSPELFFASDGKRLTARPMKGTAQRGATPAEDEARAAALRRSEKDRAENLMIVDLIRNDLGRIAATGRVRVDSLFAIETYPTLHQMVSTVSAELAPGSTPEAMLRALFPCGSITGTPKIRAEEIIHELEQRPRGAYCGAIGYFGPDAVADFNVAIRTLTIAGDSGTLGIGSGVVADSEAGAEYDECLLKARFYTEARTPIALIETLRWEPQAGFIRGALHLARLARGAAALGIPFSADAARDAMNAAVDGRAQPTRLRVVLGEDGGLTTACQPFVSTERWTYAVSPRRMQSGDLLARHKTGWRVLFEEEFRRLNAATGCDQVLFLNERDELVEGNGTNIFLRRGEGLLTPPLAAGALAGCLRQALLESGEAREEVLRLADLAGGVIYLGNSLRGLVPAFPVMGA
jgi:para-aminobenzoate synthetase/4-amino-4-deoxychorismate lyase